MKQEVEELERLLEKATDGLPLPWEVWTSCSFRRVKTARGADVLSAYNQRSDGHPDLSMPEDKLIALVGAVNALPAMLTLLRTQQERIQELEKGLEPFARAAPEIRRRLPSYLDEDTWAVWSDEPGGIQITLGDFARARSLLQDKP